MVAISSRWIDLIEIPLLEIVGVVTVGTAEVGQAGSLITVPEVLILLMCLTGLNGKDRIVVMFRGITDLSEYLGEGEGVCVVVAAEIVTDQSLQQQTMSLGH